MASRGKLTFSLGLSIGDFSRAMRQAIGLVVSYKAVMSQIRNFGKAISLGSDLGGLSAELGESAGTILVLQQAFRDANLDAGNLATSLNLMRQSIGGINELGQRTEDTFAALGLSINELRGQNALEQYTAIGKAISKLSTQADRTSAAMNIFGRSGAGMLRIFSDPNAFEAARKSLGSLPDLMDRVAPKMFALATAWGRLKTSFIGFYAGTITPFLDKLSEIVQKMNEIDFTRKGLEFGARILAVLDVIDEIGSGAFFQNLFSIVSSALVGAFQIFADLMTSQTLWNHVGGLVLRALDPTGPIKDWIGGLRLYLNRSKEGAFGLPEDFEEGEFFGYRALYRNMRITGEKPFGSYFETRRPDILSGDEFLSRMGEEISNSILKASNRITGSEGWQNLSPIFDEKIKKRLAEIDDLLNAPPALPSPQGASYEGQADETLLSQGGSLTGTASIPSDQWARVGAFVGGALDRQVADNTRATARYTSMLHRTVTRIAALIAQPPEPVIL